MALNFFAGIPVKDFKKSLPWYEQLFGAPPSFFATETEAIWQLADNQSVYIEERPERASGSMNAILVDDLDALVAQLAERGLEVDEWEHYDAGVRKAIYRDPDGNEFGYGNVPS